jgi:hypothetical protein
MKYRKKSIVVEAVQWFEDGDHSKVKPWEEKAGYGWIKTLEGGHVVTPGDWIVKGIKGEFYAVKPDIFFETYEDV